MPFTHLHLHTEYSLLDGAIRLRDLPKRLKELGMDACAITDHGVLYGVIDFYQAMLDEGIKPILGCEVYVSPRGHTDKQAGTDKEPAHLVLLAENEQGYQNLMRLVSIGFIEGFYYRPRVDHALLEKYHDGLIVLSACLGGEIPQAILSGQPERARELAEYYQGVFGPDHFYLEIQDNGLPEQNLVNSTLITISRESGIPLVATNDCHYLEQQDAEAHEVLLCMQTGKRMSDPDHMRMSTDSLYVRSPESMATAFAHVPEAIENTARIAARCKVVMTFYETKLPAFEAPPGIPNRDYLRRLCEDGLQERLQLAVDLPAVEYQRRLDYELSVIEQMGFVDYYLIVWDFIRFAREAGIMVGPGRGSGAGSLAAWCLKITNIDPLRYNLIFERFLNVERVSMPDFDIDFCYERRPEVIQYVTRKYGQDRVAQVITFGTLAARACIRDVARALDVPYAETDRIAKMVPGMPGMTLRKALDSIPELRQDYENNEVTRNVLNMAMRFEGMPRHSSTHAAGVVIAGRPLTDIAPLSKNEDAIVVQFAKNNIEKIGLLKFDFLGLRTLTVMRDTADMVRHNHGINIDYDRIPMDDALVFAMLSEGRTEGVFQLESPGMTAFMKELKPETLEDVIAGISLYRPGPMEQIPRYVEARHDPSQIRYDHPLLEPILNVTYGCIVYQEQVMQIVRDLAGFSMGQSDNVRRAMSKKKPAELAKYKTLFLQGGQDEKGHPVAGAIAHGVSPVIAEKIFEDVMAFAGYAFNKSHAAAYAVIAYHTGWLKQYYPVEFMAAMLNSYMGNLGQAASYVRTCRKMGIQVLPPDINRSSTRFTTEQGAIRFSLAAVKNVGEAAIRQVLEQREKEGPYKSFGDFLRRLGEGELNRKMIESLIKASTFDLFGVARSQMLAVLEPFTNQLTMARRQNMEGQLSLFEMGSGGATVEAEPDYPRLPEFSQSERLGMEKEMLGLYVTGHPLDDYDEAVKALITLDSAAFSVPSDETEREEAGIQALVQDDDRVIMAGILTVRRNKTTRKNEMMSFLTLEDLAGTYEVIVFPKLFQMAAALLTEGQVLLVAGRLSVREEDQPKVLAEQLAVLDPGQRKLPPGFAAFLGSGQTQMPSPSPQERQSRFQETGNPAKPESGSAVVPIAGYPARPAAKVLVIRYLGSAQDEGYQRLRNMLRFFHGEMPVRIWLEHEKRLIDLPPEYWIEYDAAIFKEFALRYGAGNMGLV